MYHYFAPMEGLTDSIYRKLHHRFFPGIDRYYTPFLSPTVHRKLTSKEERELPPAEQELFRKRYLEGYTAAELGKMYGLPPATVRTRLAKARRYLSQLLMEE